MRIGILSLMGLFCLISSVSAQDITLPYFEDFESATVGDPGVLPTDWINASEGTNDLCTGGGTTYQNCLDWGVNSGGTASSNTCLLYTSPSPRDRQKSRMPSSA